MMVINIYNAINIVNNKIWFKNIISLSILAFYIQAERKL